MTYEEFKNMVISGVQKNFEMDKFIAPMLFFLILDEKNEKKLSIIPVMDFFTDSTGKDLLSLYIENECKTKKIFSYCIVSESWMAIVDENEDISNVIPSKRPDRKEIVMLLFETKHNTEMMYFDIIRNEDDAKLSELQLSDGVTGKGRFSQLLCNLELLN